MSRGLRHTQTHQVNKMLYKVVLLIGVIEPLATIPQIIRVWVDKQVTGVSMPTWGFYALASCIWLSYGIKLKNKPIIISSILWIATEGTVVLGLWLKR